VRTSQVRSFANSSYASMFSTSCGPVLSLDAQRQAGILLANMIESYLDHHDSLPNQEPFHESPQDHDRTPEEESVRVRPPVDARPGAASPGEHRPAVRPERQGPVTRLERETDLHARPRPGNVGDAEPSSRRLQDAAGRCFARRGRGRSGSGSLPPGSQQHRLAPVNRTLLTDGHIDPRRRRRLQSSRLQQSPSEWVAGSRTA
jgi:hypothetical protein